MDPKLQLLIDEAEIRQVHIKYCRGIDRMDWELVRSCYHPDAIDRHGPFEGGVDDFIDWVADLLPNFETTTHFAGNQLVNVDGDVAHAEHYTRAYHRTKPVGSQPATDWILNLRYIDRMEKRQGEWRIAYRIIALDSERTEVVIPSTAPLNSWHHGKRNQEDLSYEVGSPVKLV